MIHLLFSPPSVSKREDNDRRKMDFILSRVGMLSM